MRCAAEEADLDARPSERQQPAAGHRGHPRISHRPPTHRLHRPACPSVLLLQEKYDGKFDVIIGDLADPLDGGPCYQLYTQVQRHALQLSRQQSAGRTLHGAGEGVAAAAARDGGRRVCIRRGICLHSLPPRVTRLLGRRWAVGAHPSKHPASPPSWSR